MRPGSLIPMVEMVASFMSNTQIRKSANNLRAGVKRYWTWIKDKTRRAFGTIKSVNTLGVMRSGGPMSMLSLTTPEVDHELNALLDKYLDECFNCKHEKEAHTTDGKCLFATSTYDPISNEMERARERLEKLRDRSPPHKAPPSV